MDTVRFGIIGMGYWNLQVHIPNLLNVPQANIAAVSSRKESNLDAAEKAVGQKITRYTDYQKLFSDPDIHIERDKQKITERNTETHTQ